MRNRLLTCIALGILLLGTTTMLKGGPSPKQPAAQKSQTSSLAPDFSGVWTRLTRDGAIARGYPPLVLELLMTEPPMTPWAAAKYKANKAQYRENPNSSLSDPIFSCYPPGLPRIYLMGFPMQIVQTPDQMIMLFEFNHFVRRIYTDGRPHDSSQGPLWMGDSIGKWEGDTLLTDTNNFNDKTLIDRVGHPHSAGLHMTERIRLLDPTSMEITVTLEDPKAFTHPWDTKLIFEKKADWKIMEHVCEDNDSFIKFGKKATTHGTPK